MVNKIILCLIFSNKIIIYLYIQYELNPDGKNIMILNITIDNIGITILWELKKEIITIENKLGWSWKSTVFNGRSLRS